MALQLDIDVARWQQAKAAAHAGQIVFVDQGEGQYLTYGEDASLVSARLGMSVFTLFNGVDTVVALLATAINLKQLGGGFLTIPSAKLDTAGAEHPHMGLTAEDQSLRDLAARTHPRLAVAFDLLMFHRRYAPLARATSAMLRDLESVLSNPQ